MSIAGDARFWDRMSRKYSKSAIADQAGYERSLERTRALLTSGDRILELGCGTGSTALRLAADVESYIATDLSAKMIAIAEEKNRVAPVPALTFRAATAETLAGEAGQFDAVLGFNYLHLLRDVPATLRSIHGLLAADGLFISNTHSEPASPLRVREITMSHLLPALLFAICAMTPVHAQDNVQLHDELQEVLDTFRDRYDFPGATAAAALPDGTVIVAATGLADVEAGIPMTPDSRMLAASIGKTFVAATVLQLESDNRLSRTDLLADHLGDRAWFNRLPNAGTITIGHLLHHSTGLPDHVYLPEFQGAWEQLTSGDAAIDPEGLIGFVTGKEPLFAAGSAWAYSDTGYLLLGLVIEEVTGVPWSDAVRARFLDPLLLTGTISSDRSSLPGLAIGYVAPDNPFGLPERTADSEGRLLWNPDVEGAGGGFASTSHDLALWGHLLFGGEAMAGPYLDRLLEGVPVDPDAPGVLYGAGVAIYADTPRGPVYGHGGWVPAYVSSLRHYADHDVTVAFQINTDAGIMDDAPTLCLRLKPPLRPWRSRHCHEPGRSLTSISVGSGNWVHTDFGLPLGD